MPEICNIWKLMPPNKCSVRFIILLPPPFLLFSFPWMGCMTGPDYYTKFSSVLKYDYKVPEFFFFKEQLETQQKHPTLGSSQEAGRRSNQYSSHCFVAEHAAICYNAGCPSPAALVVDPICIAHFGADVLWTEWGKRALQAGSWKCSELFERSDGCELVLQIRVAS